LKAVKEQNLDVFGLMGRYRRTDRSLFIKNKAKKLWEKLIPGPAPY